MLYSVLKSSSLETVPKVLEIVHQTKRIRHKEGLDEELYQYVQYDIEPPRDASGKKPPRVINLDNVKPDKYKPPENIVVHLSKIVMPELQPKPKETERQRRLREEAEREARKREEEELAALSKKNGKSKTDKKKKQQEKEDEKLAKRLLEEERKKAKKGKSKASPPRADDNKLSRKSSAPLLPSGSRPPNVVNFAAPIPRPSHPRASLAPPHFPPHQRTASSPRMPVAAAVPYPPARPVSAFGSLLGPPPPPPPPQDPRRSSSPSTLMDSLVYKFRTIAR